jgi:hypothetical protein
MEPFGAMGIDYYESNEHEILLILMRSIASQLKGKGLFSHRLCCSPSDDLTQDSLSCVSNLHSQPKR